MAPSSIDLVHLSAPINFPIKLTSANFPIWRRQVESTLIGFGLLSCIDGSQPSPSKFTDVATINANPKYLQWYRRDQILLSALLGSCGDRVQSLISSVASYV
ncbi:hypothetical protein V6N13_092598 [Hibiscus sabdariffa]